MSKRKSTALVAFENLSKYQLAVKLRQIEMDLLLEYCRTRTYYHEIAPEIAKAILEEDKERIVRVLSRWGF